MSTWTICWTLLKMLYQILWWSVKLFSIVFNIFWFICTLASAGIPWFTLMLIIVCIGSKYVKLRNSDEKHLMSLLPRATGSPDDLSYWPIANQAAGYDAPENSKAALVKCAARGYRSVLLDAGLTKCGEIVIVHSKTLELAGLAGYINDLSLEELKKINIAAKHPLGSQFEAQCVLTLSELLQYLEEELRLTIFLNISDNRMAMIDKLKKTINENPQFLRRIIITSNSPLVIYQLRKSYPDLICALWTNKSITMAMMRATTLYASLHGAIMRNIISPVIGVSVVFINKEEFNLHIGELWRNVGVRPIVYNINSPNEKSYFQKTMKTQYLTDSLRSEPHLLMKA